MKTSKRGRKPIADKKKPVTVFIPQSVIQKAGGPDAVKQKIRDYITATGLILICLLIENFIKW